MLSIETEYKLADIFLALAEGEKSIDINRQILVELDDFDPYQIFTFFDIHQKNHINISDLQLFLQERGIITNEIEIKLIILFYDSDYDGVLSYPEFSNFLQCEYSKRRIMPNNPQQENINQNISNNIDQALRQLFTNELELAKKILPLLKELKMRYDFNMPDLYHAVKNWNYIEENSLRNFFGRNKISYLESDIKKIMKRLDFNRDGKIDLCEFHAFLGFPECQFYCPIDVCNSCGTCCCDLCISDVPCFIHNCVHTNKNNANNNSENNIKNNLNFHNENNENNLNSNNMENQNEEQNQTNKINPIPIPKTMQQRSKTPSVSYNLENNKPNREQSLYNNKNINNSDNIRKNSKINKYNLNFNNYKNMENSNQEDIENYNFNYSNGIRQSDSSNSFLGHVSDNLVLRASPQRKYSPKVFHCNPYRSNLTRKSDYLCNFIYNPEPCEKCIHNHCDFCHEEIYPTNNANYCNNYSTCVTCHNFPCCCCSSCHCYPCRCKCCPICRSIECKCCPQCHTYPCKCCPVCNSLECKCCPSCKKYPCKCCPVCHLEECCCCKLCHKYPCVCCPKCHFPNCRCCTVCNNYPCVCCPVCHMANCICCENCKNYPCRCCPDCHCVNCQCCIQCGCYPCRCCDSRCNCCQICGNMPCQTCNNNPCNCCPYCHFNPCKCPGCTCEKQCIAMNLNAMNCPIHNVHSMKHNEGCPFSPKCPHSGPKCAHSKKENNYRNNNDLNNNSNNNSSINNSNNNSNNIPNNNFNHNHQIHNHPYGHFYPHNHHFPKNAPNKNSPNNSITYSYQDPNNNYPNNEGQDSDNDFNNQSKDNNVPNSNENQNNNNGQNNNQYNKGPKGNQYNNGPKNNESSNDNDYNNNIPNNEKNENDSDNDNIPYGNQYDNNIQNPNPSQNENQGYPNNSCPLSPVSSAFPPNSPFFNANEPGQKSNWVFCPKCNVYHRCPHPGCEHNPSKRTTTHKCIKDEDNQDQVQISNNSSQNMNNPNQNNPQNNINNSNNGPNMSTPNFNNNNFISFNPNAMGSNHGRMNQSQNSKKKPPRKRDVFSSCPYQEELGQFVDFLGFLMEVESKIEDMKIELARREDFNFEDIFRIFEVDGKGYIEPEDLKQGLKLLGLNPTDFDINLLLKRFDLNQQGLLTYSDFFDMVVSFEKKLRNSVQIRPPNSCCPCKSPDVFECDTLIAIKNLFKFIIDCEREINQIRANFDSLRSKYSDVVQFLDYTRRGIITRSDLKLYLTQFNKFTTSKECDLLFIRLDKTRSGEVGIDEIENELMFLR